VDNYHRNLNFLTSKLFSLASGINLMKRFLLLVLLFSTIVTFGQHKPFQFGFRGGLNTGWFATDVEGYSNNGTKIGGSWGFVADIFLMENYSFTTGFNVIYVNGSLTKPPQGEISSEIVGSINSRYLELPLIFTLKTKEIKEKFRIYWQVGLGISFLLKAKTEEKYTTTDGLSKTETRNIYKELTATRESLILGTGIELPIHGSTTARFGLTFDNAFINILKGDEGKARNNFFEINLAVLF
jgi:hypothetical protein